VQTAVVLMGFDAVELFAPSADAVDSSTLKKLLIS